MIRVFWTILISVSLVSLCNGAQDGGSGNSGVDPNLPRKVDSVPVKTTPEKTDIDDTGLDIQPRPPVITDRTAAIFSTYVDQGGYVDYQRLRHKRIVLINAEREINKIHHLEFMSWSNKEKMAFWINTYNLFTLKMVVDEYPIQQVLYMKIFYPFASIRHIIGGRTKKYYKVRNLEYTIDEIEEELQRFNDPRVNLALSYASIGGALLRNEAYDPKRIDEQLTDQIRKYLKSPNGMRIDRENKTVFVSNIFNQHKSAFISKYGSIKKFRDREPDIQACLSFITSTVSAADTTYLYISKENAKFMETQDFTVQFIKYDWRLNDRPWKKTAENKDTKVKTIPEK